MTQLIRYPGADGGVREIVEQLNLALMALDLRLQALEEKKEE